MLKEAESSQSYLEQEIKEESSESSGLEKITVYQGKKIQRDKSREILYEKYAISLDILSTLGLGVAASYETSPLQYFLGFGAFCSGLGVITGRTIKIETIHKLLPVLGTATALLSAGYYFIGDFQRTIVMAGLSNACFANSLSNFLRSKKEENSVEGLMDIL